MQASETERLIKETAGRVRRRDFLWIGGLIAGLFIGLAIWGQLPPAPLGLACALLLAGLAIRYRFSSARAWARPIETLVATELQAREAELRPLRLVRGVLTALPEPLFLLDEEGRVEIHNPAAETFLGAAAEGKHLSTVLRAPAVLSAVGDVLDGAPSHAVDFTAAPAIERNWQAYVALLDGENKRVIVMLRDLTAERRLQRMREDFIANASHELRTPLASMSGFIETLRGHAKDDPEAQDKFLTIMQDQADRMGRLIKDLMSLSRIELNEHVPPSERVDVLNVVGDVIDGLQPIAIRADVSLTPMHNAGASCITGDRDEIIQVLQNLVDNAIKYGGSGKTVEIETGRGAPPDFKADGDEAFRVGDPLASIETENETDIVYIQVRDQGAGIARSDLPRLTERFYRVDVKESRQMGGTGLGLAIVKHIINRHRGGLRIESAPGTGSAFTVFFPAAEAETAAAAE